MKRAEEKVKPAGRHLAPSLKNEIDKQIKQPNCPGYCCCYLAWKCIYECTVDIQLPSQARRSQGSGWEGDLRGELVYCSNAARQSLRETKAFFFFFVGWGEASSY